MAMTKQFPNAQLSRPLPGNENLRFLNFAATPSARRRCPAVPPPRNSNVAALAAAVALMHGVYGCQWNWWLNGDIVSTATDMLRMGAWLPMMIAMPSDGLWGDGTGYVPHAHADYEKWIADDVPGCLRELFPQLIREIFSRRAFDGWLGAMRIRHEVSGSRVPGISAHSSITHVSQLSQFIPFPEGAFQYAGDRHGPAALGESQSRTSSADPV